MACSPAPQDDDIAFCAFGADNLEGFFSRAVHARCCCRALSVVRWRARNVPNYCILSNTPVGFISVLPKGGNMERMCLFFSEPDHAELKFFLNTCN